MMKRLLLLSGSKQAGSKLGEGLLDWASTEISDFLGSTDRVTFVPFANPDGMGHQAYTEAIRPKFAAFGYQNFHSLHEATNPQNMLAEIERTDAIFVGGGNTFLLLRAMYASSHEDLTLERSPVESQRRYFGSDDLWFNDPVTIDIMAAIRERVESGHLLYMGSSAGSNLACPTIMTTNDMPIVYPPSLDALNIFPVQINPHYLQDPEGILVDRADLKTDDETAGMPSDVEQWESILRPDKIRQYLTENPGPVLALKEGSGVRYEHGHAHLFGEKGAFLFKQDGGEILRPHANIDHLLN